MTRALVPTGHVLDLFNSLQKDKNLPWAELMALADDRLKMAEIAELVLGRVKNIVGKGENAGYQHFLLFPQCFQKFPFPGSLKTTLIVW